MKRLAGGDVEAASDERGQRHHLYPSRGAPVVEFHRRVEMERVVEMLQFDWRRFFGWKAEPLHDVFGVAMDFARVRAQKCSRVKVSRKLLDVVVLDRQEIGHADLRAA